MKRLLVAAALALLAYVGTKPIYIDQIHAKYGFIFPEDMPRHEQEAHNAGLVAAAVVILVVALVPSGKDDERDGSGSTTS